MLTDLLNFGREQLENGTLFSMLEAVGISNADDFINGFRNQTREEAERIRQSSRLMSVGESVFGLVNRSELHLLESHCVSFSFLEVKMKTIRCR